MANESTVLSWGKPTIKSGDSVFFTPVENTTQLTVTKGDKKEALVEGGGVEAVKYKRSKSQFKFNMRHAKGRTFPLSGLSGGVVAGEHPITMTPEDPTAPGFTIPRGIITVDETYTAEEGAMWEVTVDALTPTDGGEDVQWSEGT